MTLGYLICCLCLLCYYCCTTYTTREVRWVLFTGAFQLSLTCVINTDAQEAWFPHRFTLSKGFQISVCLSGWIVIFYAKHCMPFVAVWLKLWGILLKEQLPRYFSGVSEGTEWWNPEPFLYALTHLHSLFFLPASTVISQGKCVHLFRKNTKLVLWLSTQGIARLPREIRPGDGEMTS